MMRFAAITMTRMKALFASAVFCCAGFFTPAYAADRAQPKAAPAPAIPVANSWSGQISLYGWASGLDGTVQSFSRVPAANVNIGFDQLLKNLDGALMLSGSATNGHFVVLGDIIYAKVSPKKDFSAGRFDGSLTLDTTSFIGLAAGGYRVYADPAWTLDLLAGVRVFSVTNSLTLALPRVEAEIADRTETWVDGVVGLRAIYALNDQWHLTTIGLVGGISSRYEWDVLATIGYKFTQTWSGFVGYRALGVDYRNDGFIYDVVQHGPLIGITARF